MAKRTGKSTGPFETRAEFEAVVLKMKKEETISNNEIARRLGKTSSATVARIILDSKAAEPIEVQTSNDLKKTLHDNWKPTCVIE